MLPSQQGESHQPSMIAKLPETSAIGVWNAVQHFRNWNGSDTQGVCPWNVSRPYQILETAFQGRFKHILSTFQDLENVSRQKSPHFGPKKWQTHPFLKLQIHVCMFDSNPDKYNQKHYLKRIDQGWAMPGKSEYLCLVYIFFGVYIYIYIVSSISPPDHIQLYWKFAISVSVQLCW